MMDLQFFISDVSDIPQQLEKLICIVFHGPLSQSQLMELLNLVIIIPVKEVFLLEIILELFPPKSPFTDPLYLLEVFPTNGCSSIQIEYCNSCLHVPQTILNLKLLLYPKKPRFSLLSSLYLTIKRRRFRFLEFILSAIPMVSLSFPFMRRRAQIPTGFLRITLLHFDQKSDGRHVGFSTLPCRMYDTLVFL